MTHAEALQALTTAANWHKATFSAQNGGCVEIATIPGWVGVRDTKLGPNSPVLAFTPTEWDAFTNGVRSGEFDLASGES